VSERYAELINDWRAAAARAREAQQRLNAKFEAHLAGGPEPTPQDIENVRALRTLETAKLHLTMEYIKRTAGRPPVPSGGQF
jgi:hypothetical protein